MSTEPQELSSAEECYRCGYDLRGILDDQPCPECGLLAERSRRVSDELHDTRPRWLRRISTGLWGIVLSLVMLGAWPFFNAWMSDYSRRSSETIALISFLLIACVFWVGVLFLTTRENYPPADQADHRRRIVLRASAALPLLGGLLMLAALDPYSFLWTRLSFKATPEFVVALWLILLAACAPLPGLLFFQLRSLGRRARSQHLVEHCAIVGIATSAAVVYTAAMFVLFEYSESFNLGEDWVTRSSLALVMLLLFGVAAFLFLLWSLYLIVRFAIAFHRAAVMLRRKWALADRSVSGDRSAPSSWTQPR